jgi:hypothetical protein
VILPPISLTGLENPSPHGGAGWIANSRSSDMKRSPPTTSRNEQRCPEVSRTGGATEDKQAIEDIVGRAFLTAHLLTGKPCRYANFTAVRISRDRLSVFVFGISLC